jgi:hypothetical protein
MRGTFASGGRSSFALGACVRLIALLLSLSILTGCNIFKKNFGPSEDDGVAADDVFWRAYMDPSSFDAWLADETVDSDAASCINKYAEKNFADSRERLRQCGQLLTSSPEWTRCHEESESLNDGGVVANDIANAIQRRTRFDQSQGGLMLIQAKSLVSTAEWNSFIQQLRAAVPPLSC